MKIQKWFNEIKQKHPEYGDVICFNCSISGRSLTKSEIGKSFDLLVSKQDYQKSDRDEILEYAYKLADIRT